MKIADVANDLQAQCRKHMAEHELEPSDLIITDGKIHRYSIDNKKNKPDEWYVAFEGVSSKGNPYLICIYSSWSIQKKYEFKSWANSIIFDDEERKELHESLKKKRKETEEKLKKEHEQAAKECKKIWESSEHNQPSEKHKLYLQLKGVKAYGIRYGYNQSGYESIIIPLRNNEEQIRSLQYISVDLNGKIYKNFHTGGEKKGNYFVIGHIENGQPFNVCEGYATGASPFEAINQPVVVAFDSGNLSPVIENLRKNYKDSEITILADDDKDAKDKKDAKDNKGKPYNAGKSAAEIASKQHGCSFILPQFPNEFILPDSISKENPAGKRPTDFNDLHCHFGIAEVKRQLLITRNDDYLSDSKKTIQENLKCRVEAKELLFKPYSFAELLEMPQKHWLIDQVIGEGDIGMIYGPPGCGKTFAVIDLIITACTGGQWATRFLVQRPLNVAYCAGEGISGLPSRFKASAKYHGITSLHNFTFYKTVPQLYNDEENLNIATIKQFSTEWKARQLGKETAALDILVIDTLHTATTTADENSAQDMGKVLHSCRKVANDLGCAVIFVHHTNKGGTSERGSSALRGAMDFMIEIKKPSDTDIKAVLSCSKLKDGEQWEDQNFLLHPVEGSNSVCVTWENLNNGEPSKSKDKDKNSIIAEMERYPDKSFTSKSLSEVIGKKPPYTIRLLNEIIQDKKCERELRDPEKKSSSRNPWVYRIVKK